MEDPTKTIDYLRARLLAERSVSRTARQRAYELAKRVAELEKQLKFVSLQRKKAEKATADVLAILESHGRNDLSEPFDSSSDEEEMSSDFKDGKHTDTSEHLKTRESDAEGFSGSEVESSSLNGRSLSWKSSKNSSSRFLDKKYMDASKRRRDSFTSNGSSPRRVGKSCRQIRHREHRSVANGSQNGDAINGPEDDLNSANVATESLERLNIREEKDPMEVPTSCNGHSVQNYGTERDMERALEHQAQFIARYEAEEKAQREWEDKFRENNGSSPDSCDPGTHSDVTEENDEIKASPSAVAPAPATPPPPPPPPPCSDKVTSEIQELDVGAVDANFSQEPKSDAEPFLTQKNSDMKTEASDNQNRLPDPPQASYEPTLGNEENADNLGSVLEALQQAKLSLKQNLDKYPLLENGPSTSSAYKSGDKFPVPFSSAGLFRLPTDYEYGGTTTNGPNSLTYDSGSQFISSPYRESLSRSSPLLDDRFRMVPTFPYRETTPEITKLLPSTFNPRLDFPLARDPRLDVGMGPSSLDPRLGMGASARDPRLDVGPSFDQRLGLRQSALDLRPGVGPSVFDSRFGMGQFASDPRSGIGQFASDPRLQTSQPITGDRYMSADRPPSSAGLPPSVRYATLPGGDIPLRTRSLYDDYTRPDTYE
ncbi:hypothetical protein CTI12_AA466550 [Artemisia annua]|uniref:Uncharacterized protein n=1 Tax=Artemisia annua TaxID=35608 RepID=A0A2U1LQ30_ARTAN|nr:hypothetical protein CTI12_AA466550 [Artemisia annua]